MQRRRVENLYHVLNVPANASDQEIKSAFIELSKKYHPDSNSQSCDPERFSRLWEAYNTLHRPSTRKQYDNSLNMKQQRYFQADILQHNVCRDWRQFHTQMRNRQKSKWMGERMAAAPLASSLPVKSAVQDLSSGCLIVNNGTALRFKWCCTGFSLVSGLILISFKVWRGDPWTERHPILVDTRSTPLRRDKPPSSTMLDLVWACP
ncbi:GL23136 [Drosophila persimilis]|uniref:GL23136 n=1 Tax=Drosophila persimilis TaxID=7234 RepID=B4G5N1_DROPE|nr:uncharacterized protein LOC6587651 [Drosophila persimilis]EDW24897.1 GL23136 [Drosophila persimilis]